MEGQRRWKVSVHDLYCERSLRYCFGYGLSLRFCFSCKGLTTPRVVVSFSRRASAHGMKTQRGPEAWARLPDAAFHAKGPTLGSPLPADNSWAGNTRGDSPTFCGATLLCDKCFLDTTAACFPPGAWDFPNPEKKRKRLRANSLKCRPSVATELIPGFPQCQKGNLNTSAYYQNFKL